MSRHPMPALHCDGGEEYDPCTDWAVDYYELTAHSVGGVRVTETERHPGWRSTRERDLCPEHAAEAAS